MVRALTGFPPDPVWTSGRHVPAPHPPPCTPGRTCAHAHFGVARGSPERWHRDVRRRRRGSRCRPRPRPRSPRLWLLRRRELEARQAAAHRRALRTRSAQRRQRARGPQPPPVSARYPQTGCGRRAPPQAPPPARREVVPAARPRGPTNTHRPSSRPRGPEVCATPKPSSRRAHSGAGPRRPVPAAARAPTRARPRVPDRGRWEEGARSPGQAPGGAGLPWPADRAPRLQRRGRTLGTRPRDRPPSPALDRPSPVLLGPQAAAGPAPLRPAPARAHWAALSINFPRGTVLSADRAPIGLRSEATPPRPAAPSLAGRGAPLLAAPTHPPAPGPRWRRGRPASLWGARAQNCQIRKGPRLCGWVPWSRLFFNARLPASPTPHGTPGLGGPSPP